MKRYLEHMHKKDPHDRRVHALQVASVITGFVFIVWVTTLGARFTATNAVVAQEGTNASQAAAVAQTAPKTGPRLEVSTTSVFLPQYSDNQ